MSISYRVRHALLACAVVLGVLTFVSAPATATPGPRPNSIPGCNGNYPSNYAQFWHNFPWPVTGTTNQEYRVKSPNGTRWVWIWGGRTYQNVTDPKLPPGTWNEYDTQFLSSPGLNRGPGRFVRDRNNHRLYYTFNHYQAGGWCYVGTQYGAAPARSVA